MLDNTDAGNMQIYSDLSTFQLTRPTVLTIGNFDGIHRGHQALLGELQRVAAQLDAASAMLTFDPHPFAVLRPDQPHLLLTTPMERLRLIQPLGIDLGIIQPFTRELAALEPWGATAAAILPCWMRWGQHWAIRSMWLNR